LALGQEQQEHKQQFTEERIQEPFTVEPLAKGSELEEQELNFRQEG
jgi:hypothetical protein